VQEKEAKAVLVKNIMKSPIITVGMHADFGSVISKIKENSIRRVPVVEAGKLVGIITETNIVDAAARLELKLAEELAKGDISLKAFSKQQSDLVHHLREVKDVAKHVSTGSESLNNLLGGGFPFAKNMLIEGSPGSGKSQLAYSFLSEGIRQGDVCIYICYNEKIDGVKEGFISMGFEIDSYKNFLLIDISEREMKEEGEHRTLNSDDDTRTKYAAYIKKNIQSALTNRTGNIRCVVDIVSQLMMFWKPQVVYKFILEIAEFMKTNESTSLFLIQKGMQETKDLVSIEQIMDGAMEFSMSSKGKDISHLFRIKKMRTERSLPQKYFTFSFRENNNLVLLDEPRK
jgi:KaiC/GvpD/RAD55 family RecA-like ATPase